MKKEQHIYKIQDEDKGIVYIFNVTRREKSISLESVWLVVIHNGLETKIILDIPGLMGEMLLSPENAADDNIQRVIGKWFSDMELAKDQIIAMDMDDEIIDITEVEGTTDYDDIVKEMLNGIPKKHH
jgi:hypothetical protein